MSYALREQWLQAAADTLAGTLFALGYSPVPFRVSCGWPSRNALGAKRRRVGECWHPDRTQDGKAHVFVSPLVDDPLHASGILLHEMVHGIVPVRVGHRGEFAECAERLGFDPPYTGCHPGKDLTQRLNELCSELGPYPHRALPEPPSRGQTTRLRLWECAKCRVKVRVASDTFYAQCLQPKGPLMACGGIFERGER